VHNTYSAAHVSIDREIQYGTGIPVYRYGIYCMYKPPDSRFAAGKATGS
jgi:hypothetical protein